MEEETLIPTKPPSWGDVAKNLAFIAIAVGVAYYVTVTIGIDDLRETVARAGVYAPLIIILLKATTIVVVPLGGTPLYPIAGALWGFWKGLAIVFVGDALGATIAFYLSRFFGRKIVAFFMPRQHIETVEKLVKRLAEPGQFLKAKLFFAGFPELFVYAAGLTNVSYFLFILVHMGVHVIASALLVTFGNLLVSGNWKVVIGVGIVSSLLAFAGIWKFHADLRESA